MKFEYLTYKHFIKQTQNLTWDCDDDGLEFELNSLGQKGWELVSTEAVAVENGDASILLCIFKQPLA